MRPIHTLVDKEQETRAVAMGRHLSCTTLLGLQALSCTSQLTLTIYLLKKKKKLGTLVICPGTQTEKILEGDYQLSGLPFSCFQVCFSVAVIKTSAESSLGKGREGFT